MIQRKKRRMKIKQISENAIRFDNGTEITFAHEPVCCEKNYADFRQLDDLARDAGFDGPLVFEPVEGKGFRFGNPPQKMFFVPCYSVQNGFYSAKITIHCNGRPVLDMTAELLGNLGESTEEIRRRVRDFEELPADALWNRYCKF